MRCRTKEGRRGGVMKLARWMDGTRRDSTGLDGTRSRMSESESDEGTESSECVKRCDAND